MLQNARPHRFEPPPERGRSPAVARPACAKPKRLRFGEGRRAKARRVRVSYSRVEIQQTPTIADASHRRYSREARRPKAAYALPLAGGGKMLRGW